MTAPELAVALAVLGGGGLIVGGIAALYVDLRIQLNNPDTARPIFVRYVSLATQALDEWPHWIFVMAMTVFCPCVVALSQWMAVIGRDVEPGDDKSWLDEVEVRGLITGLVGPILAASPMGNPIGSLVHVVAAVCFLVVGLGLANSLLYIKHLWIGEDDSIWPTAMARLVTTLNYIGIGCIVLSFFYAMVGTGKLDMYKHNSERNPLTSAQILRYRVAEACLAVGEICQALCVGTSLLACSEVQADLTKEQMEESDAGLYGGIATAYAVGVAVFFYATNGFFIKWCQRYNLDTTNDEDGTNDNHTNGDDDDADRKGTDENSPDEDEEKGGVKEGVKEGEDASLQLKG